MGRYFEALKAGVKAFCAECGGIEWFAHEPDEK